MLVLPPHRVRCFPPVAARKAHGADAGATEAAWLSRGFEKSNQKCVTDPMTQNLRSCNAIGSQSDCSDSWPIERLHCTTSAQQRQHNMDLAVILPLAALLGTLVSEWVAAVDLFIGCLSSFAPVIE